MARREVKGGTGEKFALNVPVVGTYQGMREGQFGPDAPLVDIEIDGEIKTYFGKTVLAQKLRNVEAGEHIEITFLGLKPGKKGKTYNDFSVFIGEDEAAPAPAPAPKPAAKSKAKPAAPKPAPAAPAGDDEEVPF